MFLLLFNMSKMIAQRVFVFQTFQTTLSVCLCFPENNVSVFPQWTFYQFVHHNGLPLRYLSPRVDRLKLVFHSSKSNCLDARHGHWLWRPIKIKTYSTESLNFQFFLEFFKFGIDMLRKELTRSKLVRTVSIQVEKSQPRLVHYWKNINLKLHN
jgi:hypothetical protein